MFEIPKLWAGTQESFDFMLTAYAEANEIAAARAGSKDPFELPPLLETRDGVAVISMKGPLVPGNAGFMRIFGITGYADLQEAFVEAATTKGVKSALLYAATGGGAVEGADETSQVLKQLAGIKPVVTYAGGNMASAGVWVGSAGTKVLVSATSIIGSVGVLVTHIERSKQLEKDGIVATIVRSGKWKALVNGIEPLSEEAKKQLQAMVDDLNQIFESRLAVNYGVSPKVVHDKMGQGREFLGVRAVEAGFADGIASFQEAFAVAKILGSR